MTSESCDSWNGKAALYMCAAEQGHSLPCGKAGQCGSCSTHADWPGAGWGGWGEGGGGAAMPTGCARLPSRLCLVGPQRPGGIQQARRRCSCKLNFLTRHVNTQKLIRLRHTAGVPELIASPDKASVKGRGMPAQNTPFISRHRRIASVKLPPRRLGDHQPGLTLEFSPSNSDGIVVDSSE